MTDFSEHEKTLFEDAVKELSPQADLNNWLHETIRRPPVSTGSPWLTIRLYELALTYGPINHFWALYQTARQYSAAGEKRMAYVVGQQAFLQHPDWKPCTWLVKMICSWLLESGMSSRAVSIFLAFTELHPEVAQEAGLEMLKGLPGIPEGADIGLWPLSAANRINHLIYPRSTRLPSSTYFLGSHRLSSFDAKMEATLSRRPVSLSELKDATVLVHRGALTVLASDGEPQPDLTCFGSADLIVRRFSGADQSMIESIDVESLFIVGDRFPTPNLCHFLLDQLPRLSLLSHVNLSPSDVIVLGPESETNWQKTLLGIFGVDRWIHTNRFAIIKTKLLLISSDSALVHHGAYYGSPWAVDFIRARLGAASALGKDRIFVSRCDASYRNLINEREVVDLLSRYGFRSVTPGLMSYEEQLATFRNASHVVGVHGAALAHVAVCAPDTQVLEIHHPMYGTWPYAMITIAIGACYTGLVAFDGHSDRPEWNDPRATVTGAGYATRDIRAPMDLLAQWAESRT